MWAFVLFWHFCACVTGFVFIFFLFSFLFLVCECVGAEGREHEIG